MLGPQPTQDLGPRGDLQGFRLLHDGLRPQGHDRLVVLFRLFVFLSVVIVRFLVVGEERHQDGGLEEQSVHHVFHLL